MEETEEPADSCDSDLEDQDVSNAVTPVDQNPPKIGGVVINDSTDIHVGNKTYYNGNVTIKQFVYGHSKVDLESGDNPKVVPNGRPRDEVINIIYNKDLSSKLNAEQAPQSDGKTGSKTEYDKVLHFSKLGLRAAVLAGIVALVLLLLLVSIRIFVSSQNNGSSQPTERTSLRWPPIDAPAYSNITGSSVMLSDVLHIVNRNAWLAASPTDVPVPLKVSPVPYVIFQHTATENCTTVSTCKKMVRTIQDFHMMSNEWNDIAYNFLVGGDGYVYVGRGWDYEGAHTLGYNKKSLGVAFIGLFSKFLPPEEQIKAAKKLIEEGIKLNKIAPNYKLLGHCQLISTESPGKKLYQNIQTWPHWSPTV